MTKTIELSKKYNCKKCSLPVIVYSDWQYEDLKKQAKRELCQKCYEA